MFKKNQVVAFRDCNETIIAEVLEFTNTIVKVANPLIIHRVSNSEIGFAPFLYTDPKEMKCEIAFNNYMNYIPDKNIVEGYVEYVTKITSSIIQLDKSIKPVQILNG